MMIIQIIIKYLQQIIIVILLKKCHGVIQIKDLVFIVHVHYQYKIVEKQNIQ